METLTSCLCGETRNHLSVSKWGYRIVECDSCGLAYVNPRHFAIEADDYFRGAYLSTIEENGKLKADIEQIYEKIVKDLSTYLVPSRVLDVGCAMGHFMVYARALGWSPEGIECSAFAAAYGREHFGLKVKATCDLRDAHFEEESFDACVLIEVAEHLPYPLHTFTEAFRLLKPGGLLYVTTPNWGSFRSLLRRDEWTAVIPTGHLYYFKPKSMDRMLRSLGFTDILDLTVPAEFASEVTLARATGSLRLDAAELQQLASQIEKEDAGLVSNSRGEGLSFWAKKPPASDGSITAAVRASGQRRNLQGKLVSSAEDQKVYLVHDFRKRWVTSVDWLHARGMRLEDVIQISQEELQSILEGPALG